MVNKSKISRLTDAMSVLGLRGSEFDHWTEDEKALWVDVADLDAKNKSSAGIVYKSEQDRPQFYIEPQVHKGLSGQNFYVGPRNVTLDTAAPWRYREPGPSSRALARKSLGLPADKSEQTQTVYSARVIARASLGLS